MIRVINVTKTAILCLLVLASITLGCRTGDGANEDTQQEMKDSTLTMTKRSFGLTDQGEAHFFTLTNANGMRVECTNYGAIITRLFVPDRDGNLDDIVLGFDSLAQYEREHPYFGAIIGRYGNRIGNAAFSIDGQEYTLAANNGPNALHGGPGGFHTRLWEAEEIRENTAVGLELKYTSADGEEGYPGQLEATVRYLLTNANELRIEYEATTNKPTHVNLTQHSYFNLRGAGNGDIMLHEVMINASHFTPVDETLIPTGELHPVAGTPFDFRTPHAIGERINADKEQLEFAGGYDHNFVLDQQNSVMTLAATVYEPVSGRFMEVLTEEPGLQFYSGNFLDGTNIGKGGTAYHFRTGFCMETQHFPDAPNKPHFPSTLLRPGETYQTSTVYRFSVR